MFAFGAFLVTFRSSFFALPTFERTFRENTSSSGVRRITERHAAELTI